MSREQIWERIKSELVTSLGQSQLPNLELASRLRNDLGLSSLKTVDLIIKLEDAFDVAIADEELATLVTASDLVDLIESKTTAQ